MLRALTQYKPAGTNSFRLASSQLFGFGVNAQNFDKDVISCIEAPPGHSIVQADQSGAEALAVAYLSPPGRYRDLFIYDLKPHIYVALHLFIDKFRGRHPKERYWLRSPQELKALPEWKELAAQIKDSKFEYDIGKRTGHASNYRMGPNTFRESTLKESEGSLVLSHEQAVYFLTTYKTLFPEIVDWQAEIEAQIREFRLLRNLFGYPRRFERIITDGYIREGISWIPQSTIACITHHAYKRTADDIRAHDRRWRLFNNKHDSYAALVPDAEAIDCGRMMAAHLGVTLVGRDGAKFTMKSEVQIGRNWGKFHAEKNPNGMKEVKI